MAVDETQIGLVKDFKDGKATVIMNPQGGCSSCAMHGLCGTSDGCTEHIISTDIDLKPGDKVIVYIDPSKRILSAFLLFIFPITLLVIFYYIANIYLAEKYAVMFGLAGFVLAFIINRLIDKVWGKNVSFIIASKYEDDLDENHS